MEFPALFEATLCAGKDLALNTFKGKMFEKKGSVDVIFGDFVVRCELNNLMDALLLLVTMLSGSAKMLFRPTGLEYTVWTDPLAIVTNKFKLEMNSNCRWKRDLKLLGCRGNLLND